MDENSRRIISLAKEELEPCLSHVLISSCTHVKGHGGVKKMAREVQAALPEYPFSARFDVASFYETINHEILLLQLEDCTCPSHLVEVVRQYLAKPYTNGSGIGLTAGGSISPLLGGLYLHPLDTAFARLSGEGKIGKNNDETALMRREWTYGNANAKAEKQGIFYRRFMDDIIILAKTRWMLRKAIKLMYNILHYLDQRVHRKKKIFIVRTERGFDLLGYHFTPRKKLVPSAEILCRMLTRASRLWRGGVRRKALAVCVMLADLSAWWCFW